MPAVVINELSAVGQAANAHESDAIMRALAETLRALEPVQRGGAIHTHSSFCNQPLSGDQTVYAWLFGPYKRELQAIRLLLSKLLRSGPYIDTLLADVVHTCHRTFEEERTDHAHSSLAGAAHLRAWLVSLRECSLFPPGPVTVHYGEGEGGAAQIDLTHLVDAGDVQRVRRIYESNPKHERITTDATDGFVASMDLSDEEAQQVLDGCVSVPEERRVCGLYKGRVYVFHEHLPNRYHGFPMKAEELQHKMPTLYKALFSSG